MANTTVISTYRVRPEAEDEFVRLLHRHWQTLAELGFATQTPAQIFRSRAEPPTYVEIFEWAAPGADPAHDHPDVIDIWESMDALLESRDGHPGRENRHVDPVTER